MTEPTHPSDTPSETPAEEAGGSPAPPGGGEPSPPPRRRWLPRRRTAPAEAAEAAEAPDATEAPPATTPPPADGATSPAEPAEETEALEVPAVAPPRRLRRDRRRLITRREEAVYHLGGLAFELYRRDLLAEDVMRRRAGEVAEIDDTVRDIDVRLGEIERERRERRRGAPPDPSTGCCLVCRTPFRAEARFCWQCGTQVVPPSPGDEQVTAVISTRPAP